MTAEAWQYAGEVGVDSGHVMIADPCYWVRDDRNLGTRQSERSAWTWMKMLDVLLKGWPEHNGVTQLNYRTGRPGLGVCVSNFGGDVNGAVYVQRAPDGSIVAAQVRWDGALPEGER